MQSNAERLRIVMLTHYFPPEVGAPQSRLFELASRAAAAGHSVTVVTGFPNYPTGVVPPAYRGRFRMEEKLDGVRVIRTWVYATPNRGFVRRVLNHLSFAASSLLAVRRLGHVDVFFVESPPLFIGLAALAYRHLGRAPYIFNVSDIWPQSAVELGALRNGIAVRLAEMLEMRLYRKAARVSVVTPGMIDKLAARGVPREKLFLLTNGVDTQVYRPQTASVDLARSLGLDERKIFLYAGTHGMAQGLGTVLEAAKLTQSADVVYVLAGEGAEKESLVKRAESEGIANVRFLPNQPRSAMPDLLNLAYATIVPLRRLDLFKAALPSKMFESMATAKPIVASVWGEAAALVEAAGCGLVTPPEDAAALRDAVEKLAADPALAGELGENGRRYVQANFDREILAARFIALLQETAGATIRSAPMKRVIDVIVSAGGLVVTSPIILAAAIAIKADSPGPVFYRGPRVGKDGEAFGILKLRTMRAASGPAVTAGDDPRITPVGRFLRRTKVDELPQLVNVLRGEMSLVGPRPEDPKYVAQYTPEQRRVLAVRPGITGPTALEFLDEEDLLRGGDPESVYVTDVMPQKLAVDMHYVEHASFGDDMRILGRTISTVVKRIVRRGSA
jgi:lipopolysaccharide/colanic/teichoic acid biosynthesis glycosyltransferase/glycosyltransferase involved in cell wall biosynthesis